MSSIEQPRFMPEDNQPGHHPEQEQDKPSGPPPTPKARQPKPPAEADFDFAYDPRLASFLFGVIPATARIHVDKKELRIRFGPWTVKTRRDNIDGAEATGPYSWAKVAGPPHLSFADGGLTMATTTERGVCIRFKEPIAGIVPGGLLRHPAVTVTPRDPDALLATLNA